MIDIRSQTLTYPLIPLAVSVMSWSGVFLGGSSGLFFVTPVHAQSGHMISQTTAIDYLKRGVQRSKQDDLEGAIADYTQAIRLDPTLPFPYALRCSLKVKLGTHQGAIDDCTEAIRLSPPDSERLAPIFITRGSVRALLLDFEGAIADYTEGLRHDPNMSLTYAARGYARFNVRDFEGAIADLDNAIRLDPKSALAFAHRSETFLLMGKTQAALKDADQAIRLAPKLDQGFIMRGAAKISQKDFSGAQHDFKMAGDLDSDEPLLYYWSGQLSLKQGDFQKAISDYDRSVSLSPRILKVYENYTLTAKRQPNASVAAQPTASPTESAPKPQNSNTNSSPSSASKPSIYKIAGATTVMIQGQNPGSGVIFSKSGNTYSLLTAKHVVATPDEYEIITASGKSYPLNYSEVTKFPSSDLAVVQFTSNENLAIAQFGDSKTFEQGETIYISGWPAPDAAITQPSHLVTKGELSGVSLGNRDGYELLYDTSTGPGMSGGPIFDGQGNVIGIHGRAAGNSISGKVGINLGIPIHLFLQQAPKVGLTPPK